MAIAIDGSKVPSSIEAPCGASAQFDHSSGIGYRCEVCFAVIGSIGMPRECADLLSKKAQKIGG